MAPSQQIKLTTIAAAVALAVQFTASIRWAAKQEETLRYHIEFSDYQNREALRRITALEQQIERLRK